MGVNRALSSLSPSAYEAAHIIVKAVQLEDRDDLWQWRNDPDTRTHSLNTDSVSFEQHCKWFESAVNNSNQFLLLGFLDNKLKQGASNKIGMVRFDIAPAKNSDSDASAAGSGTKAIVSINLNPDFRGKGLSAPLLIKAIDAFRINITALSAPFSKISYIEATIKEDNKASINCFQRAGFVVASSKLPHIADSQGSGQKLFRFILD